MKIFSLLIFIYFTIHVPIYAQSPDFGAASSFAVFTAIGAFNNTGEATNVVGDVGTNVGAFNAFPPGVLVGDIHVADPISVQAAIDVDLAYAYTAALTCGQVLPSTLGNGQILTPDIYCIGEASTINNTLFLDGECNPDGIFIFQINGALSTSTFANIVLLNSASICNIYWQVNGAVNIAENAIIRGNIIANGAISLLESAELYGRALSRDGAISLANNFIRLDQSPTPSIIIANGPTTFCQNGSVVLSGNCGGTWSNGSTEPSITVTQIGTYTVTNTNDCGSATSNIITININPIPNCNITGDNTICQGSTTTLCAAPGAVSYQWSNGATTDCITVNIAGTYFVTITDGNGCTSSCNVAVTVSPIPTCSIIGDNTICQGGTTTLCATPGAVSYQWSNGATTDCITVNIAGTYFVTITDGNGCTSSCNDAITVSPIPTCSITGDNTICQGGTTTLCAAPGAVSYQWSNGATTECITVSTAGTYNVTITDSNGCTSSCNVAVTVSPIPTCSITGDNTICQGGTTTLCAAPGAVSYQWSNGANTDCITVNIAGTYFVTITDGNGCTSSCNVAITVSPIPTCSITGDNTICQGSTTTLCSAPGAVSYQWSNGATTDCITVNTAGTYFVTITDGNGCTSSCNVAITVSPIPTCSITGDNTICQGGTTTLCAAPGAVSYQWSNGATTECITVSTAGTYNVIITDSNGCINSCNKTLILRDLPYCEITGENDFCEESTTEICANQGNFTYFWSTGETTRCILVGQAGTYLVTITDGFGCSSICEKSLTTNPLPVCEISGLEYICEGSTNELCLPPGYDDYWWADGQQTNCIDGSEPDTYSVTVTNSDGCKSYCSKEVSIIPSSESCIITGETVLCGNDVVIICAIPNQETYLWSNGVTTQCIAVTQAGEYSVTVSQGQVCITYCSVTVIASQEDVEPPVIFSLGSTNLCQGDSVTLYGNVQGVWSTGETSPSITSSAAGTYFVINENPCGDDMQSNIITVSVTPNPDTALIYHLTSTTFCEGDSVILHGNTQGIWNTGDTTTSITVSSSGIYFVTNSNNCDTVQSNELSVTVIPMPNSSIFFALSSTSFCEGQSTILSGNINGTWNTGETTPSIEVSTSGDYYVIYANDCDTIISNSIHVQVSPLPIASTIFALEPTSFCQGSYVVLHGNTNGVWSTGDTTSTIKVDNLGSYFVTNTNLCGNAVSNAIVVQVTEVPQCHIAGNLNPKAGETIILCAPEGVDTYKWNTFDKTRCITITESGMRSVTVTNNDLCTDSCSVQVVFSDITNTSDQDDESLVKFKIYPNPFYDETTIEFKHQLAGQQINVDLFNVIGEQVKSLQFESTESNQWFKINLQGQDLVAGIYMAKLTSGKTVLFKKLILIK
jgi:trimeric autotransporter adhesin